MNHELTIESLSDVWVEGTCSCDGWSHPVLTKSKGKNLTTEQAEIAIRDAHRTHVSFVAVTTDLARDKGR